MMLKTVRRRLGHVRRKICEYLGIDWYSRPALNNLDRKLEKYLDFDGGVFVELGANNGLAQSNTYYFEAMRGWTGILVEPVPALYQEAVRLRPHSKVFNCACVPFGYSDDTIEMTFLDLMSMVKGAMKDPILEQKHYTQGQAIIKHTNKAEPYILQVPTRTLTSVLDEAGVQHIDLLSLDVEGYELDVLKGLDFERYAPEYMLIEARFRDDIEAYILDRYEVLEEMSQMDVLYRRKLETA